MTDKRLKKIVIVGGGTAGWMCASVFARFLKNDYCDVTLIESEALGTVGVGEATIPQMRTFNRMLNLDEDDFMRMTKATFKLGIEFIDWGQLGERYIHPFGPYGRDMEGVSFHAYWLKLQAEGQAPSLDEYSLQAKAARAGKFMRPIDAGNSPLSEIAYAFHFDAILYANYLRKYSEERGVTRLEGKVIDVALRADDGFIDHLLMENGETIEGDLFVDCSGFRGVLIEQAMETGYTDWKKWLPCDSAVAMACELPEAESLIPYTRATAHEAGWRWRIPLQHRMGNGYVYSSQFAEKSDAQKTLMDNLEGEPLGNARHFHFTTGRRNKFWNKNCLSLGLSAGFLEPLESTAIHLVQVGLSNFMAHFPDLDFKTEDSDRYNRVMAFEYEKVRDFIILHYKATQRDDSDFWNYCRTMEVPEYLQEKMDLFKSRGRIFRENDELFNDTSWFSVMVGQGIIPEKYDPLVDIMPHDELHRRMTHIREIIARSEEAMPLHKDFIAQNCAAEKAG